MNALQNQDALPWQCATLPQLETAREAQLVRDQLLLALSATEPDKALSQLVSGQYADIFSRVLPEITRLQLTPQDPVHHPEGNVWLHTLAVMAEAQRIIAGSPPLQEPLSERARTELLIGILLHDIGKGVPGVTVPRADTVDPDLIRYSAHDHERLGVEPARGVLERLDLMAFADPILAIVEHHMRFPLVCMAADAGEMKETRCINRMKTFIGRELAHCDPLLILYATVADRLGRGTEQTREQRELFTRRLSHRFLSALEG